MAESIELVFARRKKSRSSGRLIAVPQWLRHCGEQWCRFPNVESVLLFGSRATGHATPSSDWDVAVLHTGTEEPRIPCIAKHYVEIACLSVDRYCAEAHLVGSLAHEISHHAMLIAGRDNYRIQKELGTSEEDLKRHLRSSFKDLAEALTGLHHLWKLEDNPHDFETVNRFNPAREASGNGAKHVTRALCVHLGISYEHTHDLEGLAKEVPAPWRSKVLAMGGNTRAARMADHTEFAETCGATLQRVDNALGLLSEFLIPCLEHMSKGPVPALIHELNVVEQVARALDLYRSSEDVYPPMRDLLKRYHAYMELVLERNHALDLTGSMEDDLEH